MLNLEAQLEDLAARLADSVAPVSPEEAMEASPRGSRANSTSARLMVTRRMVSVVALAGAAALLISLIIALPSGSHGRSVPRSTRPSVRPVANGNLDTSRYPQLPSFGIRLASPPRGYRPRVKAAVALRALRGRGLVSSQLPARSPGFLLASVIEEHPDVSGVRKGVPYPAWVFFFVDTTAASYGPTGHQFANCTAVAIYDLQTNKASEGFLVTCPGIATAKVSGVLKAAAGPTAAGGIPVNGTVVFRNQIGLTYTVRSSQHGWSVELPVGRYSVHGEGCSPDHRTLVVRARRPVSDYVVWSSCFAS